MIFNFWCSDGRSDLMCVSHLYLLFMVIPKIFSAVTCCIGVLLQLMVLVQLCFWQIWRCWHLAKDRYAPEYEHQLFMSCNKLSRLKLRFLFLLKFIMRKKSSAYALNLISLCKVIMFESLLNAIRNRITDIGDPCGIPLHNGSEFDMCGPTLTIILRFSMKFLT